MINEAPKNPTGETLHEPTGGFFSRVDRKVKTKNPVDLVCERTWKKMSEVIPLPESALFSVAGQTVLSLAYNRATWSSLPPPAIQGKAGERRAELHRRGFFKSADYVKIGKGGAEIWYNPRMKIFAMSMISAGKISGNTFIMYINVWGQANV